MSDDAQPLSATESFAAESSASSTVGLTIIHHPRRDALGARLVLARGSTIILGRDSEAFGSGRLSVPAISRQHASVTCDSQGTLSVTDHGSRNGTFVNTAPTTKAKLSTGDVIRLGPVVLVVGEGSVPGTWAPLGEPLRGFVGFSEAWAKLSRVGAALACRPDPVLIWGVAGSGRHTLAEMIAEPHRVHYPDADARQWPADGVAVVELSTWPTADVARLVQAGTPEGARCVAIANESPAALRRAGVPAPLLDAMAPWTLSVASLRERPADVAALVWEFTSRFGGPSAAPTIALVERLVRMPMAADARRAESLVERAVLESNTDAVGLFEGFDTIAAGQDGQDGQVRAPAGRQRVEIARSGAWVRTSGAGQADLHGRPLLQRLVAALVCAHQSGSTRAMDVDSLFAAGWPGDQTRGRARTNRVYVALTKLRKLGLANALLRTPGGYSLDPDAGVEIVDDST